MVGIAVLVVADGIFDLLWVLDFGEGLVFFLLLSVPLELQIGGANIEGFFITYLRKKMSKESTRS